MSNVHIDVQVPAVLAVSLVHIAAQQPRIVVSNRGVAATDPTELEVRIAELSLGSTTVRVPRLEPGRRTEVDVSLSLSQLDRARLLDMVNQHDGLLCRVIVRAGAGIVAERAVRVLPPNAWLYGGVPEALAVFVDKESDGVQRIKLAARPYLRRHLGVVSFIDAIQKPLRELKVRNEFDRMKRVATSIYECLQHSHNIHYEAEPRTYPEDWQKIRFHDQVMNERQGTCVDLALLAAACLEEAFLNPVLILFKTGPSIAHVLVGCWKSESMAESAVIRDYDRLNSWLDDSAADRSAMLVWDPTGCSAAIQWTLSQARDEALAGLRRAGPKNFGWAVDIARCREKGISPLPFGAAPALSDQGWQIVREAEGLARRYQFDVVERALLLLALIDTFQEVAHQVFGADATRQMRQIVDSELTRASPARADVRLIHWTRSARRARDRAARLAEEHGAGLVGPLQLWQALIEDPGSRVGRALAASRQHPNELTHKLIGLVAADPQRVSYLTGSSEP